MEETTNLDAGIIASEEETLATDGIMSEESDTTDVETDIETDEVIDQEALRRKKNAEKAKKMLAEKNEMKARIDALERDNAMKDLKLKYGEFDAEAVIQIKEQHPSLSYEDALLLNNSKHPQPTQPSSFGISGMESRDTSGATITVADLGRLDSRAYAEAYDKIKQGKLKLVNG